MYICNMKNNFKHKIDVIKKKIRTESVRQETSMDDLKKSDVLDQLTKLGGKIEGNIFSIGQEGDALEEIKSNWDSHFHSFFAGKE